MSSVEGRRWIKTKNRQSANKIIHRISVKRDTGSLADLLEDKGKGSQRPTTMVGTDEKEA